MVPVDMSVEDVHAAAGLAPGTDVPAAPEVNDLDNWSQEAYSLSVSTASDLGFPVGNITASFKREALMFGSSRWKDVVNGGHTYRFGVALRAIVVVSDILGSGALTLPVVAAKVELEGARASAQLLVRGYKCNALGDLLPAWQSFGVDAYGQYMKSVSDLQKEIMGDAQNVVPELLATTVVARPVPAAGEAVGSVYALHAIAEGATLAHALDKLGINDSAISGAAKVLYQSRIGDDERAVPDTQQRQDALDELQSFHISRNWFKG
jgi:hypothetical protein